MSVTDGDAVQRGYDAYQEHLMRQEARDEDHERQEMHEEAHRLRYSGPICIWCGGRGKIERYVHRLRRIALIPCPKCAGTGHRVAS